MINANDDILVIAAIDGDKLVEVLNKAQEKDIPVIAYDRLIMNTDALMCYASFDNEKCGQIQGRYIEAELNLRKSDGPYNIEIFSGDTGDNNALFYYRGAMDVLKPYIEEGKLIVKSGEQGYQECSIDKWNTETAKKRMDEILKKYYSDGTKLDAVCSPNDSIANGITQSLIENYKQDFPILTGQDCDIKSVKNIIAGKQSMSIFKDTRKLADEVVKIVQSIANGQAIPINDTDSYNNGNGMVPSILLEPLYADKRNFKRLLIDSGYYTRDQIVD